MSERPSTSRTVSSDTAIAELLATTPTMFASIPSVPTSYQSLAGIHSGAISTIWSVPIYSPGIPSSIYYVETQQIDHAGQYQFGQTCLQRSIYALNTGLPPYGG